MELNLYPHTEIDPHQWDEFLLDSPQGSVYTQYGYISAICRDWYALIIEGARRWEAVLPIVITKKFGFSSLSQAPFTQHWGICFREHYPSTNYDEYSWKREIVLAMVDKLSTFHLFNQNFAPSFDYPLPFHWKNYDLHARFTYRIPLIGKESQIWEGITSPLKRQIKKAEKAGMLMEYTNDPTPLIQLIRKNESSGNNILGRNTEYYKILGNLSLWLSNQEEPSLALAKDQDGKILAAGLFPAFRELRYYLIGAYLPEAKKSGAMSWLMMMQILRAHREGRTYFDFEGSMIQGIETFFRKFGSSPVYYLNIKRNHLPFPIRWIRELLK